MNRSNIPWCDHTWNPVTGCRHGCPYCYAKKITTRFSGDVRENLAHKERYRVVDGIYVLDEPFLGPNDEIINYPFGFEPTYHRYRLSTIGKLKGGHNIFIGAMADLLGEWVPDWVINEVLDATNNDLNNYMFLTKNPKRYMEIAIPEKDNYFYGVTLTNNEDVRRRTEYMMYIAERVRTFASIEPLHERLDRISLTDIGIYEWIILGAETGKRKGRPTVKKEWIEDILDSVSKPVFMKESLRPLVADFREEYPEKLRQYAEGEKVATGAEKGLRWEHCIMCRKHRPKKEMVTISIRIGRGTKGATLGFMCPECMRAFCGEHDIPIPELEGLRNG